MSTRLHHLLDHPHDPLTALRASPQVLLPPSAGAALLLQDAAVNGTPFFELHTASGARTHVSVLDYSAAEGKSLHICRAIFLETNTCPLRKPAFRS